MPDDFDPYQQWLGIAKHEQPPNHYRLLGVAELMDDVEAIGNAVDRQMNFVRTFQLGKHSELSQRIMRELAEAKLCLLNPATKAVYDAGLRKLKRPPAAPAPPQPVAPPASAPAVAPAVTVKTVATVPVTEPAADPYAEPGQSSHIQQRRSHAGGMPNWVWMSLAVVMTLVVIAWVVVRISNSRRTAAPTQPDRRQRTPDLPPRSPEPSVAQNVDGSINLPAVLAEPLGDNAQHTTVDGETFISGLQSIGDAAQWGFVVEKGKRGLFQVVVEYACPRGAEGGEFTVSVDGAPVMGTHRVRPTDGATVFLRAEIGHIKIQKLEGNVLKLAVKSPIQSGTTIMNVRAVRLKLLQKGKGRS